MAFNRPLSRILVTATAIGSIATGSYLFVIHRSEANERAKLEQDVKRVNRAIQVYLTHGGKIPTGQSADSILARLRREAANPRLPGVKGDLIDPRLTIRWQKTSEASDSSLRAYWDDSTKQFCTTTTGTLPGVKEFYTGELPEPLPMGLGGIDPNSPPPEKVFLGRVEALHWVDDGLSIMMIDTGHKRPSWVNVHPSTVVQNASGTNADLAVGQSVHVSYDGFVYATDPGQVDARSIRIEAK